MIFESNYYLSPLWTKKIVKKLLFFHTQFFNWKQFFFRLKFFSIQCCSFKCHLKQCSRYHKQKFIHLRQSSAKIAPYVRFSCVVIYSLISLVECVFVFVIWLWLPIWCSALEHAQTNRCRRCRCRRSVVVIVVAICRCWYRSARFGQVRLSAEEQMCVLLPNDCTQNETKRFQQIYLRTQHTNFEKRVNNLGINTHDSYATHIHKRFVYYECIQAHLLRCQFRFGFILPQA